MLTNAFWREAIDALPGCHLLFNVDENEQAHLFFVSENVEDLLGYSPESFVEKAELDERLQEEIGTLIEDIAEKSKEHRSAWKGECSLSDRDYNRIRFVFEFQLFRSRAANTPVVAVSLHPYDWSIREVDEPEKVRLPYFDQFEQGSSAVRTVWEKARNLAMDGSHVLVTGEAHTGKKSLVRKLGSIIARKYDRELAEVNADTNISELKAGSVLVIPNLGGLSLEKQEELTAFESYVMLAASDKSPELLLEKEILQPGFFYSAGFTLVSLPPLKVRHEDQRKFLENQASILLEMGALDEEKVEELVEIVLKESKNANFRSLFGVFAVKLAEMLREVYSDTSILQSKVLESETQPFVIEALDLHIKHYLAKVMQAVEGKVYGEDGAAKLLKVKPTTLQSKLKKFGIR